MYFGSISSKSLPFVSGTTIITKHKPTHDMQAKSQNAPSSPSSCCKIDNLMRTILLENKLGQFRNNYFVCAEDLNLFLGKKLNFYRENQQLSYLEIHKRLDAKKCTKV